ncbi:MAG TPA: hypothetical protein VFS08_20930 [Gemmatimonadaceae bacterium]|nr:hypothetical protein [Gemmatimonadaceae bacterium]
MSAAALGAVGLLYCLATASLQALARHAESSGVVYPYRDEDWLRYLLPSLWPTGERPLLLLAGPSTVREDLLVEEFRAAFPSYRAFQGGVSLGTLGDVLAGLEYVERVRGPRALPAVLVLGVSPRFLAEIPDERPFAQGLERYSQRYRAVRQADGRLALVAKPAARGLLDHARFLARKQQPRYGASVAWLVSRALPESRDTPRAARPPGRPAIEALRDRAAAAYSPYRYRAMEPWPVADLTAWLDDSTSWWRDVYRWDAGADPGVHARIAALLAFTRRHGIDLYVVNLPDRALSRERYAPRLTERYSALLRTDFAGVPLLDLRCLLPDDQFLDAEHALVPGARLVTRRVIAFVARARAERTHEDGQLRWPARRMAIVPGVGCCPGGC